ncbi:MAG: aminotransferase class III-fold pyridoxal phosphate-dependent enzyme [Clostridia bacterium]|jgi:4-aminobutyrate aminotransferase/diaminobutyrate-pyruvate transaminase/4-aminobutyrate aminotransferase/(S)-3-amino-2-methylpropionate transaminase
MAKSFEMTPRKVAKVETKNRRIVTEIPVPESMKIIEDLRKYEPRSMSGQPLVVWDKAEGFNVYDKYGNKWLDFSSGVLVTNSGHTNPEVKKAIIDQVEHGLLHNYCFPSEIRAKLVKRLSEICPEPLKKVFLLTTGAESTECAIKLSRTYGIKVGGNKKIKIVTFEDDFHGRTLGALMAGGSPNAKKWVVNLDPDMVQVPFPNAFRYSWADETNPDYSDEKCFGKFLEALDAQNVSYDEIAGIMPETFQGGWVQLMPVGFAKKLREFCDKHDIVLTFDEVQAGFNRSGKLFAFQHYGVKADLVCCGKGISSSLPLSAIIGRPDIMDLYGPNEMTSTHTGNPVSVAAALANVNFMVENHLADSAVKIGEICKPYLEGLRKKYPEIIGSLQGCGAAWGLIFVKKGSKDIDPDLAHDIVRISIEKGLLFFAPVGAGATIKVCPPLIITEEALKEGLEVFAEAIKEAVEINK